MLEECNVREIISSNALGYSIICFVFTFFFISFVFSQQEQIFTKSFPLTFNDSSASNKLWMDPLNILDGDVNTFSYPKIYYKLDDDGFYYILFFQRPLNSNGELLDNTDYGTIVKVQLKIVYGLFEGISLSRFSTIECEGYNRRLDNIEIPGIGVDEKITETADITDAVTNWSFTDAQQWDELFLRFSTKYDVSDSQLFHLYDIQLLITYIKK